MTRLASIPSVDSAQNNSLEIMAKDSKAATLNGLSPDEISANDRVIVYVELLYLYLILTLTDSVC